VAILYVSHRLDEVLRLCHRVTAFRDGRSVAQINKTRLRTASRKAVLAFSIRCQRSATWTTCRPTAA